MYLQFTTIYPSGVAKKAACMHKKITFCALDFLLHNVFFAKAVACHKTSVL